MDPLATAFSMPVEPEYDPDSCPAAHRALSHDVFELVQQASQHNQLKKGANEVTKTLNRGAAELVVVAADSCPLSIVLHLPLLCEDKTVPCAYVSSKAALGQACGVSRAVVAAVIIVDEASELKGRIHSLKSRVVALK